MKTRTAAFAILAGLCLVAVGCEEKKADVQKAADAAKKEVDKAADKTKAAADAAKKEVDKATTPAPAPAPK
ncbi:MAG: hypothetical protein ACREJO_00465 [Phycisphaerales bacterium]